MLRPEAFQQPYVTLQNLPYSYADGNTRDTLAPGGVLGRGQVVWTTQAYAARPCPTSALAFVDEVGIVSLDPRWLMRADLAGTA